MNEPLKILELFGGIGAPRKALENLGYNLFCDSDECQKARNARKQKAYRDRKAIEKAQKQKKKSQKA